MLASLESIAREDRAALEHMDPSVSLAFAADGMTAASGAFNAAWLFSFASAAGPARRVAAVSLAILNAGAATQAVFAQWLFTARRLGWSTEPFFEPGAWLASRLLLLAGTLLISMLILRRSAR
jgi:hypothetical protein